MLRPLLLRRPTIPLAMLAAVLLATVYAFEKGAVAIGAGAGKAAPTSPVRPKPQFAADIPVEPAAATSPTIDPFAPRHWQAPPPPPVAAAPPPTPVAPVAPMAPAGPPPLPFKFMGQFGDDGKQVVYLSHGEQVLLPQTGATLEGEYKVLSMDAQRIEFEYLPTGAKQFLSITAQE